MRGNQMKLSFGGPVEQLGSFLVTLKSYLHGCNLLCNAKNTKSGDTTHGANWFLGAPEI